MLTEVSRPEKLERNRKAVELVVASAAACFVIEHTRIESYPQQIADGQQFIALLEPLESELAGKLPEGRYGLVIDSRAAGKVSSSASPRVRAAVKEWVLQNAPILGYCAK
jgi:hypothetical protein